MPRILALWALTALPTTMAPIPTAGPMETPVLYRDLKSVCCPLRDPSRDAARTAASQRGSPFLTSGAVNEWTFLRDRW